MNPQKQKKIPHAEFDEYIASYRETSDNAVALSGESCSFFAEYKVQKLIEWFPEYKTAPISVLDFGCGDGVMTSYVCRYMPHAKVFGVDPSPKSIEVAAQQGIQVHFMTFDGLQTELSAESFDLIFAAGVFHHIPFEQHEAVTQEIFRLLKKGGRFIIFELNPFNPLTVLTFKRSPVDQNATMLFPRYARKLVRERAHISTKYYCFFPHFARAFRGFERYMTSLFIGALYAVIAEKK